MTFESFIGLIALGLGLSLAAIQVIKENEPKKKRVPIRVDEDKPRS